MLPYHNIIGLSMLDNEQFARFVLLLAPYFEIHSGECVNKTLL